VSLTNYSDLQTQTANWMARDDLTTNFPDFVSLFEAVPNRRLKTRQQELTTTLTPVNAVATLPADYLTWRRVTWGGSPTRELEYLHPSYFQALFPVIPSAPPNYFTIEGSNLRLAPADNTTLTFDYFQKIPALTSGSPTNWLMTTWPDLYLFGVLTEAHGFVKDFDSVTFWGGRRDAIIEEIIRHDQKTRGPAAIRVFGPTP
jgi:hypothetical protein